MRRFILFCALIAFISCVQYIDFHNFALEIFNKHNHYRSLHGVLNVNYDTNLAEIAVAQAKRMADAEDFFYSNSTLNGRDVGENFFYCNSFDNIACLPYYDVANYWYKEYYTYCFSSKTFTSKGRNFITMVWKETTSMGCGIEYRRYWDIMDAYFVVCDYYPGPQPTFGPTPEEIEANVFERTDSEKNPNPC